MEFRDMFAVIALILTAIMLYLKVIDTSVFTAVLFGLLGYYFSTFRTQQTFEKWTPSTFLLAQDAHFAWGLAISLFIRMMHFPLYYLIGTLIAILVLKEGVFDTIVEGNPLIWSGLIDFIFYCLGALIGFII
jgi:hypothetical protein